MNEMSDVRPRRDDGASSHGYIGAAAMPPPRRPEAVIAFAASDYDISGAVAGRLVGYVNGVITARDTLQMIFTFSAPLRDTTNVCP
jgi:hypothetical protein